MTCQDVMTAYPACCRPADNVTKAAQLMRSKDVGAIPVVDQQGFLTGIVTDRDLALRTIAAAKDPVITRLSEVMNTDLVACNPHDDISIAAERMARDQVRRIPVVDSSGRLVGIIAQSDLATKLHDPSTVAHVVEEISEPAGGLASLSKMPTAALQTGRRAAGNLWGPALAAGTAAGLMFFLDPDRGRHRRKMIRDKSVCTYNDARNRASGFGRHLANKATGLVAETRSVFKPKSQVNAERVENTAKSRGLPLGIVTTAIGGAFAVYGLLRRRRRGNFSSLGPGQLNQGTRHGDRIRESSGLPLPL